jgi:phosphoglycerate dehydrogenase-like enzyme|uniref:D-2-hydroxyacid dehydrogenase n=1 Tax=Cephaloticoccus sp. TaxID=1985742 RepID=UPI00404A1FF5
MSLTIWCNGRFSDAATRLLEDGTRAHHLIWGVNRSNNVLQAGKTDPATAHADVLFGQPAVGDCLAAKRVRWIEVNSGGYGRFDTPDFRETMQDRGTIFSNASAVFADPCAQHVLAMMLALGRNLLPSHRDQLVDHSWHYEERRYHATLLTGQTVLMLGYGAIGRRLRELFAPFGMRIYAVRRQTRSEVGVTIIPEERLSSILAEADHVVNILPDNASTKGYVNSRRLACCKPGAKFYNVGRGNTVDDRALIESLASGRLAAAYLDVFDPEPLAPDHPLWTTKNCYVTPHTAGGRRDQDEALVKHFLANLTQFVGGSKSMTDRFI